MQQSTMWWSSTSGPRARPAHAARFWACCRPIPSSTAKAPASLIRKEDTDLKEMLNKAIAEMRADGTYKKISDKYFAFDVYGS